MTTIAINEAWRITSDRLNYTLEQKVVVQNGVRKGQVDWRPEGYFSSPVSALYALVRLEVATADDVVSIRDFIKMYRDVAEMYKHRVHSDQATEYLAKVEVELPRPALTRVVEKPKRSPSKVIT